MKKSSFYLLFALLLMILSFSGIAQEKTLVEAIEETGNVGSKLVELMYWVIGAAGVYFTATGFRRMLSKDNDDEQTKRGGPMRIVIGLIFVIFPFFMNMSTLQFTGEKTDKSEIIQNPFD